MREKQWASIDINGNGFVSLAEVELGLKAIIKLPALFDLHQVIKRAFQAAKALVRSTHNHSEDCVYKSEYRLLLKYLRQYYEYSVAFNRIDIGQDHKFGQ